MGQISRTTNPTELRKVDRKHFVVRMHDDGLSGRTFWVERFDHEKAGFDEDVRVACIAHAGSTEQYVPLGSVGAIDKRPVSIRELAADRPLRFRFIFHEPGQSLLIGYADGIRAAEDSGQLGGSLVDIEPVDLGGAAWRLELPQSLQEQGARPNVLVERRLFPTAQAAANSSWFGIMVMPEVMRRIALEIATQPSSFEDTGSWAAAWKEFFDDLGVDAMTDDFEDDFASRSNWADHVVERFCSRGILQHNMDRAISELDGESK